MFNTLYIIAFPSPNRLISHSHLPTACRWVLKFSYLPSIYLQSMFHQYFAFLIDSRTKDNITAQLIHSGHEAISLLQKAYLSWSFKLWQINRTSAMQCGWNIIQRDKTILWPHRNVLVPNCHLRTVRTVHMWLGNKQRKYYFLIYIIFKLLYFKFSNYSMSCHTIYSRIVSWFRMIQAIGPPVRNYQILIKNVKIKNTSIQSKIHFKITINAAYDLSSLTTRSLVID